MPMPALVDANVWFPILLEKHEHHEAATRWWEDAGVGEACWCRPLQQTVLRLLTNASIMGEDILSPVDAWATWEKLALDERCAFLPMEPQGLDDGWHTCIRNRAPTPKLWMDAYLAAWAKTAGLAFVTFDKGFRHFPLDRLELLIAAGD